MLGFFKELIRRFVSDQPNYEGRSLDWPKVRDKFLREHPACALCGKKDDPKDPLEVHHIVPFHMEPAMELDETNLITLCRPHHLLAGHLMAWKSYNRNVRNDCEVWRAKIQSRP